MGKIAGLDKLGGAIQLSDRFGDLAGENQAGDQRAGLNHEEGDNDQNERNEIGVAQFAERTEHAAAQLRGSRVEDG